VSNAFKLLKAAWLRGETKEEVLADLVACRNNLGNLSEMETLIPPTARSWRAVRSDWGKRALKD
jgi:hypothetical protein